MVNAIPPHTSLDCVYAHIFYGSGDTHYVQNQTINEIYTGSGTYRLVPPSNYDIAYAFSSRDLFIQDASTGKEYYQGFTLEPISGILTILGSGPYPASIATSYRYYGAYASIRITDKKDTRASASTAKDVYNDGIYPLITEIPEKISFKIYGTNVDAIKSFTRQGIRNKNFFLIIDDNIASNTFTAGSPGLFQPGVAYEGPLFAPGIDLVDRGDDALPTFELTVVRYGNYYYHLSVTPTDRWWPQQAVGGSNWGWDYFKGDTQLVTPTPGYAWGDGGPSNWWTPGFCHNPTFTGTQNDLTIDCSAYTGPLGRQFGARISVTGPPDEYEWRYRDPPGAWSAYSASTVITGAAQTPPAIGGVTAEGITLTFGAVGGHAGDEIWTTVAESNAPLRLPALSSPPGGWIEWISNIPDPP